MCLNLMNLFYMIPSGLSSATSVRTSNALGAGLPHAARRTALAACALVALTQASIVAGLLIDRSLWAHVFTSVSDVVALVGSL